MIRNPLALSGAIALTLLAAAACGRKEEAEPAAPAADTAAPAPAPAIAPTPTTAAEFVPMAASANMFEIESSKIAQEKGQAAAVKDLAKTIIADHTKLGADMEAAAKKGAVAATMPTALQGEHAAQVAELRAAQPAEFDAKYLEMQRVAHEKAVAAFQAFASAGDNPDVKTVAAAALPQLRAHLDAVNKAIAAAPAAGAAAPAAAPAKQ